MYFLFRKSPLFFFELFVYLEKDVLILPRELPEKYKSRILSDYSTEEGTVLFVDSSPHNGSTRTNQKLLQQGLWICEGDCEPHGGIAPCVFGIPLSIQAFTAFLVHKKLLGEQATKEPLKKTRVAYHGTSYENYQGICAEGFKCSFGMLGTGVYLGSFWKACRFAARDQHYKFRETPSVLRVVWTCEDQDMLNFPRKIMYCFCADCSLRPEQRYFCGHTLDWQSDAKVYPEKAPIDRVEGQGIRYWAGCLKPCKFPDSEKWVTHNEEWVLNPTCILRFAECATLNLDTVEQTHYNPLQRNIKIV